MKRKRKLGTIPAMLLCMTLWAGSVLPLYAGETDGGAETETEKEKETGTIPTAVFDGKSFSGGTFTLSQETLLPGSSASSSVMIQTAESAGAANWYLSSGVVKSLEEYKSVAAGAGYTYRLTYTPTATGDETVLYESDRIRGGDENGTDSLTAALAALDGNTGEDDKVSVSTWFFLGTLEAGETGTITLTVALDGETTANSYQNSKAVLYLQLAAETVSSTEPTTETRTNTEHKTVYETDTLTIVQIDEGDVPLSDSSFATTVPKTGDETRLWLFVILFGLSCLGLAVCLAGRLRMSGKKGRGEEA